MGELLPFRRAAAPAPPMPPELELICADAELARAEESLDRAIGYLAHSRGAGRVRAQAEVEEREAEVRHLAARRLRLAGAELAVLDGGLAPDTTEPLVPLDATASPGRVDVTLSDGRALELTPRLARTWAAALLVLAETAEREGQDG